MPKRADAGFDRDNFGLLLIVIAALAVAAITISIAGLASLPMDKHEALVARTSAEMLGRGDFVVPYFNAEPRLNKPPLSYWATIAVHQIRAGSGAPLAIIDARIPSMAAMLGIIFLVMRLAWQGAGRGAALAAGAISIASPMLAYFSHDARPDTLYAFLTFAGAAALASALLKSGDQRDRRATAGLAYLGWLLWGLATLAKGPHIPLMVAVGLFIFGAIELSDWRAAWRRLRPLSGLALAALVALPWWWLLQNRLDPQALAASQLSGTLYQPGLAALGKSYRELLGIGLLFPWFLLIPFHFREARALFRASPVARLCIWVYLVPVALLLFSPQHRWHYMLPVVPFLAVFCALLADRLMARRSFKTAFATAFTILALFLAANAIFQWTWDDIRFARQQHLVPFSKPGLQEIPLAATPSIESAFQVFIAAARRPVRLLETPADLSAWQAEIESNCAIVLTTETGIARIRLPEATKTLAQWTEHGKQIELQIMGADRVCGNIADAYRDLIR